MRFLRQMAVILPFVFIAGFSGAGLCEAENQDNICKAYDLGPVSNPNRYVSFRRLLKTVPGSEDYQLARIAFLKERVQKSPWEFIRNGVTYTGEQAAALMSYKYAKYNSEAPTAEAFIISIASSSRKSGRSYLVKINTQTCELKAVLFNELTLLGRLLKDTADESFSG